MAVLVQGNEICNIGNDIYMANLDKCLERVLPLNETIFRKPLIADFVLKRSLKQIGKFAFGQNTIINTSKPKSLDFKLAIVSGPWISGNNSEKFELFAKYLKSRSIPYAFLSAGSYLYTRDEIDHWSNLFDKYPPLIFSSRDDWTYENYSHFAKYSLKSVCTSFFSSINFPIQKKYSFVSYWDDNESCSFAELSRIVNLLGYNGLDRYRSVIDPLALGNWARLKIKRSPIPCLISVSYVDYLDYYSQTDLMVSSRVHCCAPVLSYGGKAIIINKTGRKRLFDAISVDTQSFNIDKSNPLSIMSLPSENIRQKYDEFISFLSDCLPKIINQ